MQYNLIKEYHGKSTKFGGCRMLYEDYNGKIYTSKEVDLMSLLEVEDYKLHIYEK
jgi:hypothetical protein